MAASTAFALTPTAFTGAAVRPAAAAVAGRRPVPPPPAAPSRSPARMATPKPADIPDENDDGGDGFIGQADMAAEVGVSVDMTAADRAYLDAAVGEADLIERVKELARVYEEKRTASRKGMGMPQSGDYLNNL